MKNYKLIEARERKGYSQKDMSVKLNLSLAAYNLKETGKRPFKVDEANSICILVGKSYDEIFK